MPERNGQARPDPDETDRPTRDEPDPAGEPDRPAEPSTIPVAPEPTAPDPAPRVDEEEGERTGEDPGTTPEQEETAPPEGTAPAGESPSTDHELPEVADPWGPDPEPAPVVAPAPLTLEERLAGQRERRRIQARTFLMGFVGTLGVGLLALTNVLGWWSLPFSVYDTVAEGCPTPIPTAAQVEDTATRVYNASSTTGLATSVMRELQDRGYRVPEVGNDPEGASVTQSAQIRYGPDGEMAARTVEATIRGEVILIDDQRTGSVVDLVLGDGYSGLRTPEEVTALIAVPTPVGSCSPSS
jgi:hypothetical protein